MRNSNLFNPGTQADHALMLAKHMPAGKLWEAVFDGEKNLGKLIKGLAVESYRLSVLIKKIETEMDINQTEELIPEWERSVGIPNDCFSINESIERRRLQIRELFSNFGGVQKAEDFERVAAVFDFNVTVAPASIAFSTPVLFPLGFPIVFFSSIKSVRHTIVVTYPDGGQTEEVFPLAFPIPFQTDATIFLRCIFEILVPANVQVIFDFS